jgi:hypothetical protein
MAEDNIPHCSFCGKAKSDVQQLTMPISAMNVSSYVLI